MIGERLAEIRKDHWDTQMSLAKKLNVTHFTVSSWEQGKSSPPQDMLVKICKLYHISADYLLGLSDVDPAYIRHRQQTSLSEEELIALQEYEQYLIWKREKQKSRGSGCA